MFQAHRRGLNAGFLLPPHVVQFYEDESCLVEAVDDFVWDGLDVGDAVILLARSALLAELELRLDGVRAEVVAARARGQYVTLEADVVLEQILRDGRPDEGRFRDVVGRLIAAAKARFPSVRVFGEVVAILWEQGKAEEAIELEALWNGIVKRERIALRCAYPLRLFDGAMHAGPFSRVCDEHSDVIPAESDPPAADPEQHLRTIAKLQQKARALEGEVLVRRQAEDARARLAAHLEAARAELERIREELDRVVADARTAARPRDPVLVSARRLQILVAGLLTQVR